MSLLRKEPNLEYKSADIEYDAEQINLPEPPEESTPFWGSKNKITYWGFSQQGESHVRDLSPCQDRCRVTATEGEWTIIIAAIADGVGSCALAHYGAGIAVNTATSYLKEQFETICRSGGLDDNTVEEQLFNAMKVSMEEVQKAAEEMEQLEYSFQSTLTIAVYDGEKMFFAHSGDDGIVAMTNDGQVKMVTSRMKGEEVNSVYPLQAGPQYWQLAKVEEKVQGFVMATDGVLDSFVRGEMEENLINYPFIQPALESSQLDKSDTKEVLTLYYSYMKSKECRKMITDDMTIVVVTNQGLQGKKVFPNFDENEWKIKTKIFQECKGRLLYPGEGNAEATVRANATIAQSESEERKEAYSEEYDERYDTAKTYKKKSISRKKTPRFLFSMIFALLAVVLIVLLLRVTLF